jgi:uncharacterized membrane-anchored protein
MQPSAAGSCWLQLTQGLLATCMQVAAASTCVMVCAAVVLMLVWWLHKPLCHDCRAASRFLH